MGVTPSVPEAFLGFRHAISFCTSLTVRYCMSGVMLLFSGNCLSFSLSLRSSCGV
jgi:hypothetical protein